MKTIKKFCDKIHAVLNRILKPIWQITKVEENYIIILTYIGFTQFKVSLLSIKSCLDEVLAKELFDKQSAIKFRDYYDKYTQK